MRRWIPLALSTPFFCWRMATGKTISCYEFQPHSTMPVMSKVKRLRRQRLTTPWGRFYHYEVFLSALPQLIILDPWYLLVNASFRFWWTKSLKVLIVFISASVMSSTDYLVSSNMWWDDVYGEEVSVRGALEEDIPLINKVSPGRRLVRLWDWCPLTEAYTTVIVDERASG